MTDKELVKEALNQRMDAFIAGALFDFMGWLTSREERIVLSSTDEALPAVEAIKQFAKMRGLGLSDANVQGWVKARTANLGEIMGTEQLRQEMKQPEKTNQFAESCELAKLWGWAILHSDGTEAYVRPKVKEFFGTISETEPFTAEDLRKADREWCGLAPHTMVTLYTPPQPEKTNQCAETCERAKLCAVCGVSLNQEQKPVAWMYTNAQGKTVIVEGDVQPYDDAVPLFKSESQAEHEPVAEVKAKMTGGNVGIATVIHEIYSPFRERLRPGDKLYLIRT